MSDEKKIIVFRLLDQEYGVELKYVKSIERLESVTKVPRTPKFVKGVINLRGIVTPIIDLKERLGLPQAELTEESRVIIVELDGLEAGFIVDSANDVLDIPLQSIEPAPNVFQGVRFEFLEGIAKLDQRLLVLLNFNKVLNLEEMDQLSKVEGL
ncbi:purine-binding chemotaxis protein CheW [Ammoniphilus resinae]|uniref:Purine-binding chemotaxis protein CheW n=1 Tax=Ammoniphilus resinae TaxID=861532 RepID=A0ABS4GMQ2_9BACL|nr:purine-binding chemotaxis protein CheW [Ammoniphilus resinae]